MRSYYVVLVSLLCYGSAIAMEPQKDKEYEGGSPFKSKRDTNRISRKRSSSETQIPGVVAAVQAHTILADSPKLTKKDRTVSLPDIPLPKRFDDQPRNALSPCQEAFLAHSSRSLSRQSIDEKRTLYRKFSGELPPVDEVRPLSKNSSASSLHTTVIRNSLDNNNN